MQIVDVKDFIGVGITGLLGLLWFDIRGIRKERGEFKKEIDEKLTDYLPEQRHALLCENAALKLEAKMDDMKNEILDAIQNNNH